MVFRAHRRQRFSKPEVACAERTRWAEVSQSIASKIGICGATSQGAGAVISIIRNHPGAARRDRIRSKPRRAESASFKAHICTVVMEIVLFIQLDVVPGTHGYMHLDLLARTVYVFGHSRDFEDRLLVSAGSDYVGMGLLLNSFDCSSFRSNH